MTNQKSANTRPTTEIDAQRLVDSISGYAIYVVSPAGIILWWSQGAQQLMGWSAAEMIGAHYSAFHPYIDSAGEDLAALPVAHAKDRVRRDWWASHKNGSRLRLATSIDAVKNENGALVGLVFVSRDLADVTASDEALRQSEEQFQLLMRGVVDYAIYMLDQDGHVSSWNAGAERIKGYTREEILGSHFSRFYTEADRAQNVPAHALATALREGRYENEAWRVRKDGTRFFAHVVIDPIYNADRRHVGFAKITRDITEKQAAKVQLEHTQRALQQAQKLETIGKLTGGVAHDFNNLLQVIGGNLQLLAAELGGNERAQKRVRNALAGVQRGAKLASHLLAFGRRQPLVPSVVNVSRFMRGFDDMLHRSLGEAIDIETIVTGGLWNTMVDSAQLENALLNLAINARDAMNGVGKLTIEIGNAYLDDAYARLHPEVSAGQYVMLAVTDTGCGMSPDIMAQAIEPFFSTKPEGHGTGLGLSMVFGFVKQSGGHLTLYSEVGHGTTVKLYLPRSFEKEDVAAENAPMSIVGGSETILVAEDDEQVCATVVELLRGLGYQVLKAVDGESAFAIVQSGIKIDLLFTDVVMPGPLRSPDLARKAQERHPGMAVLFTSGYTQNAIVHGGRLDKGVELITKPYSREDLARKIRHVLANRAQGQGIPGGRYAFSKDVPSGRPPGRKLKVLMVDDDPDVLYVGSEMVRGLGHEVMTACDAEETLRVLRNSRPDAVLIDVGLQGASGLDLAEQVRAEQPGIGIIFATGQEVPAGIASDGVLRKPYDSSAVASVLEHFATRTPLN